MGVTAVDAQSNGAPQWSGRVPKPAAILMLQIVGGFFLIAGGLAFWLGSALDWEGLAKAYAIIGGYLALTGPFALAAGWSRPPGLVAGMVALALMLAAIPIGPILVAVIGFLGIRNREHVRDYYRQRIPKR
ncbi:MAG TPA: hypothetical protein VM841_10600 [Actinomycetota bacterium]|nr:hypothetical protein [Actinomycetota bacterium]